MVSFEKTDACLLIVIVACISYLYLSEEGNVYVGPADVSEADHFDADHFDADHLDAEASDSPSSRKCPGDLSVRNQLILDFSYSSLSIPNATEEIGDKILDQLFDASYLKYIVVRSYITTLYDIILLTDVHLRSE